MVYPPPSPPLPISVVAIFDLTLFVLYLVYCTMMTMEIELLLSLPLPPLFLLSSLRFAPVYEDGLLLFMAATKGHKGYIFTLDGTCLKD